jgi:hypothetical protein
MERGHRMEYLLKKIADLFKIKNLITLLATLVFVVLALRGTLGTDNVMLVVGMVFTYFFNKDFKDTSAPDALQDTLSENTTK